MTMTMHNNNGNDGASAAYDDASNDDDDCCAFRHKWTHVRAHAGRPLQGLLAVVPAPARELPPHMGQADACDCWWPARFDVEVKVDVAF